MSQESDLSFLDDARILKVIFPVAYSADYPRPSKKEVNNAASHFIEVDKGIKIGCKFFKFSKTQPSILYFHGNGETILDQDWLAVSYLTRGMNFFAVDYRGYGVSDGMPTISNLILDSHRIFKGFLNLLKEEGFNNKVFVMGRSLGSIPAIEIAHHYQNEIKGLIIESGAANNFSFLSEILNSYELNVLNNAKFRNKDKIKTITIPTMIIHGDRDEVISVKEGVELYNNLASKEKSIIIIPDAGHNDLMINGKEQYFSSIEDFVKRKS